MTMIVVDAAELTLVAETLRSCAVQAADIGSQLWACVECPLPADVAATLGERVAAADRTLDATAVDLGVLATDVSNRASIAANDSLAAASARGRTDIESFAPAVIPADGSMPSSTTPGFGFALVGGVPPAGNVVMTSPNASAGEILMAITGQYVDTTGGLALSISQGPVDVSGASGAALAFQGLQEQMILDGVPFLASPAGAPQHFDSMTHDSNNDGMVDGRDRTPTDGSRS
jgi:hypothetical protein